MPVRVDPEVERFISDHFDSEESLLLVLALRSNPGRSWSVLDLLKYVNSAFGAGIESDDLLAQKRLELRLRDLESKDVVRRTRDLMPFSYTYAASPERDARIEAVGELFLRDKFAVNRVIYGVATRARVLADSFRL